MSEVRIGQGMLQLAIISEQEQAFTIAVQSSCGIDVTERNIPLQSMAFAGKLAEHAEWLKKENVAVGQITSLQEAVLALRSAVSVGAPPK